MVASLLGDAVSGGNHPGVNDHDSAHALPELEVALESDTTEKKCTHFLYHFILLNY